MRRAAVAAILFGLFACGDETSRCNFDNPGDQLVVNVRDAQTKAQICDAHVIVGRVEGREPRQILVNESCVYEDRVGSVGVYTVDVHHPSYASVRQEDVRAREVKDVKGCSDSIAAVDVELER